MVCLCCNLFNRPHLVSIWFSCAHVDWVPIMDCDSATQHPPEVPFSLKMRYGGLTMAWAMRPLDDPFTLPSPPSCASLSLLQPHWPPYCSSNLPLPRPDTHHTGSSMLFPANLYLICTLSHHPSFCSSSIKLVSSVFPGHLVIVLNSPFLAVDTAGAPTSEVPEVVTISHQKLWKLRPVEVEIKMCPTQGPAVEDRARHLKAGC